MARQGHAPRRHGFRRRLAHRKRLSLHHQVPETRPEARRCDGSLSRLRQGRRLWRQPFRHARQRRRCAGGARHPPARYLPAGSCTTSGQAAEAQPARALNPARHARPRRRTCAASSAPTIEDNWRINDQDFIVRHADVRCPCARCFRPLPGVGLVTSQGDLSVIEPTARQSVEEVEVFDERIFATLHDNVRGRVSVFSADRAEFGGWRQDPIKAAGNVAIRLGSSSRSQEKAFFTWRRLPHAPDPQPRQRRGPDVRHGEGSPRQVRRLQRHRRAVRGHLSRRHEIPYFVVHPKGELTGKTATMTFGYGGFQVSFPPVYGPELGDDLRSSVQGCC